MVREIINRFSDLITVSLSGAFLANLVLGRAIGMDRVKNIEEDSDEFIFFILQAVCSTAVSILFWILHRFISVPASLLERFGTSEYYSKVFLWPLLLAVITAVVFFMEFVVTVKVAPYEKVTSAARQLPFAAFNTFVAGVVLISTSSQYSFFTMLLFTIGANLGYLVANWMLMEGNRRLQNRDIPAAFRGLPARLLYLSGLAVAFYSLTGHSLSSLL